MEDSKSKFGIPIAIVLAGLIVAGALIYTRNSPSASTPATNTPQDITMRAVSPTEHILGNPDAKVVIVEYSDPECPFCKNFHQTMHQIMSE